MEIWIVITLVSLVLSGLFSGSEIAYISSDRVRVELDVKRGGLVNRIINLFYSRREMFISTLLVGNNVMLVIYGMGAAKFLEPEIAKWYDNQAFILVMQTLISTGIILITGEFLPKTIFRINPNASLRAFSPLVYLFYLILWPVSAFTTWLSKALMRLCGIKTDNAAMGVLSIMELNNYIERTIEGAREPGGEEEMENEVKIFHNALDFSTTQLRDCMTPRNEVIAADLATVTRDELSAMFTESGRSKILVYNDDIDDIRGYIHVSELFDPEADWHEHVKPVIFAPEALLANNLMRRLLSEKRSIAVVVDEFGGTAGIVTLEDLVEEIFGDIRDEHDTASLTAVEVSPGVYDFAGRVEVRTLRDEFHIDIPEDDDYQTLAGYLMHATGSIPSPGQEITLGGITFSIKAGTATRIELVRVTLPSGN